MRDPVHDRLDTDLRLGATAAEPPTHFRASEAQTRPATRDTADEDVDVRDRLRLADRPARDVQEQIWVDELTETRSVDVVTNCAVRSGLHLEARPKSVEHRRGEGP